MIITRAGALETVLRRRARRASGHGLQAGFTLLEMLIVLVIIGLLAGLVGPTLLDRLEGSKVTTAKTQIKMLRTALDNFRLDIGRYPTSDEGLAALVAAPQEQRAASKWKGPYLDGELPADPWGGAYQYEFYGRQQQPYALYSFGSDGAPGGEGNAEDIGVLPPK